MKYALPIIIIGFISCSKSSEVKSDLMTYPDTKKVDQVDNYHGTEIADPYRWLENDTAAEVESWVKEQNAVTNAYLEEIPFRSKIKSRLEELWNYPKYSAPFEKGKRFFFYKNDGLQNQSVLYVQENVDAEPEVFMDPNSFSEDGTSALGGMSFSHNNNLLAYSVADAGSDWKTMYVMDVKSRKLLTDKLNWIKFSEAAWYKDGFFYAGYNEPTQGLEFSQASEAPKIKYHKLGTDQNEDVLIYENPEKPLQYYWPIVDDDEQYLMINISEGTSGNALLFKELKGEISGENLVELFKGFENNYNYVGVRNGELLIHTDLNAPNYNLVTYDPVKRNKWKVVVNEQKEVLEGVSLVNDQLFASYLENANTAIYRFNGDGSNRREVALPGIGTVGGFSGEKESKQIYYTFTSYISPPTIYKYDIATDSSALFRESEFAADLSEYETKQVWYSSKDGTQIPMFITHKKGIKLDGNNPTYLYAYGGFNISITPSFSILPLVFLEQGGIYAVANLRGGGEFGENWHEAGMLDKKQNVFDDFIAAAEFLISEKYTSSEKLAISGRSNGGLLVGACMTQRPDLFKVALPGVGVLDMLRYHKFTVGWGWVVEYGSADDAAQFSNLIKYSPLHNVKEGVEYPATLVTTADHDDRVVPAHSFKFIAELQSKHANKENPVLIRIDEKAGHGAGKPTSKVIDEWSDVWSFVMYNLGMQYK